MRKILRKSKITLKKLFLAFMFQLVIVIVGAFAINIYMLQFSKRYIYSDFSKLPSKYTVIVPGARVYDENISRVVRDRLDVASRCIKHAKSKKILVSGDHGRKEYDEVNMMRVYLQKIYGIDGNIIFMDHAGFSTYETMYRAKEIFGVDSAVVVSQKFHLARSVYIARKLGIDVVGYEAPEIKKFGRKIHLKWEIREFFARVKAFFLVLVKAKPTYLGKKIPITGDSKESWDIPDE